LSYQANSQNTFSETAEPPKRVSLNNFDLDIEQAKINFKLDIEQAIEDQVSGI